MERDPSKEKKAFKVKYLYQVFGLSKQGFYQRIKRDVKRAEREYYILQAVQEIRKILPRCGGRKLLVYLDDFFQQSGITIGRNALFKVLRNHGMLVKKTKNVHFRAEIDEFNSSQDSLRWYIDDGTGEIEEIDARNQLEWSNKGFSNGVYQIRMEVLIENKEPINRTGTLKIQALWIKIKNIRY